MNASKRVAFVLLFLLGLSSNLQAQAPFYQGKTIRFIVGTQAGVLYDLWARLLAAHMVKHIPGHPNTIVQNMPGAGHMIAANYVYGVAKPDGLTLIGSIIPTVYFNQLVGHKEVRFDWAKFTWIGSPVRGNRQMYIRADSPYKTIDDIRQASDPPKCGATGTGSPEYHLPKLFEETLGMKFQIVTGYQGGSDIDLAVERGELHCRAFTIEAFFGREPYHTWRKTNFVRVLVQTGKTRDPRLPDVPTVYELMDRYKTPESGRRLASVVLAGAYLGRPMLGPPGLPPDRVKTLRDAFEKTIKDPQFLADVEKHKFALEPATGAELESIAKDIMTQPPEIIDRFKTLFGK